MLSDLIAIGLHTLLAIVLWVVVIHEMRWFWRQYRPRRRR